MKLHDFSDPHATTHWFSLRCHPVFSGASRSTSRFNAVFGSSLKKVVQDGPNATANDAFWKAREAIVEGRIGKVTWARASCNRNARVCFFNEHQTIGPTAGPDKGGEDFIDWNMWLGHEWGLAPKIAWTPEHFFRFRKYWPSNGGVATDLLYHKLAPLLIAIAGPAGEYPIAAAREHAEERCGHSRSHLRKARHEGIERRSEPAVERRFQGGVYGEEFRTRGSGDPDHAPP